MTKNKNALTILNTLQLKSISNKKKNTSNEASRTFFSALFLFPMPKKQKKDLKKKKKGNNIIIMCFHLGFWGKKQSFLAQRYEYRTLRGKDVSCNYNYNYTVLYYTS